MKLNEIEEEPIKKVRKKRGTKPKISAPEARENDRMSNVFVNESFKIPITRELSKNYIKKDTGYKRYGYSREKINFNKVYINEYTTLKIANLSLRAKEMYLHIVYYTQVGHCKIHIEKEKYLKMYNIGATTFSNTKTELMKANIILDVKQQKDEYWINPFYFYNGDRLKNFEPFIEIEYNYVLDDYPEELAEIKRKYWEKLSKISSRNNNNEKQD